MRRLLPPLLLLAALLLPAAAHGNTVWLCRPGLAHNPCVTKLDTSVFSPMGKLRRVEHPQVSKSRPVDCFYVYPTVSDQKGEHANKHVDPVERSIALYQAARYSQVCRVFAPMYRQITVTELNRKGTESAQS